MYQRLHLTLHADHPVLRVELQSLAAFLRVPVRAMMNRLSTVTGENEPTPSDLHVEWTLASLQRLPKPDRSHQTGVYLLEPMFAPSTRYAPMESSSFLRHLEARLHPEARTTRVQRSSRPDLEVILQQAITGIEGMVQAANSAVASRGFPVHQYQLHLKSLPQATIAVYSADHGPTLHSHGNRQRLASAVPIPMA